MGRDPTRDPTEGTPPREAPPQETTRASSRVYRLLSMMGEGGFGTVYRGELQGETGFAKQVAIKILNERASKTRELKARLRDEARILALLRHRAIVHVEDLVKLEGRWAVVMEFVEGTDLEKLIQLGPMPPRPAFEMGAEAASALAAAHEAADPRTGTPLEVVHRDIKPANIRITPSGEVKVLDFGVSRAVFQDREARTSSLAFGSAGYMAPERFDDRDSPASDVFALGVVLLESLSGETTGHLSVNPRRLRARVEERVAAAVSGLGDPVGPKAADLLERMLAYEMVTRPTAGEVADELQELRARAEGPWLRQWIREVLPQVEEEEPPVASGEMEHIPESLLTPFEARPPEPAPPPPSESTVPDPAPPPPPTPTGPAPQPPRRRALLPAGLLLAVGAVVGLGVLAWPSESPPPDPEGGSASERPAPEDPSEGGTPPPQTDPDGEPPAPERASPAPEPVTSADPQDAPSAPPPPAEPVSGEDTPAAGTTESKAAPPPEPDPDPESEPEPEPDAAPPAGTGTGTVSVRGDVLGVKLIDATGARFSAGEVPAGTYDLAVAFSGGDRIRLPRHVQVEPGASIALVCDEIAQTCRQAP